MATNTTLGNPVPRYGRLPAENIDVLVNGSRCNLLETALEMATPSVVCSLIDHFLSQSAVFHILLADSIVTSS